MSDVLLRKSEGCDPSPFVLWDSKWQADRGLADWQLAGADEKLNRGGLSAKAALETAVTLCLFTNRRVDESHPLFFLCEGDPQGYWGDAIDVRADLHETEMGSLLWLLERAPLTIRGQSVTQWAEEFARDALAVLLAQGAVTRIEIQASAQETRSRLDLAVQLYGRDGERVFDRKFDFLWKQVA